MNMMDSWYQRQGSKIVDDISGYDNDKSVPCAVVAYIIYSLDKAWIHLLPKTKTPLYEWYHALYYNQTCVSTPRMVWHNVYYDHHGGFVVIVTSLS